MKTRTVGILGGMGPEATVDLMRRVIQATPARDDADHIRMLVDNNPQVPSRIKALIDKTGPSPAPAMIQMAKSLESQGAELLAMPCNTAHHYHQELADAVQIPFLNITQLAARRIAETLPKLRRIGLLASSALAPIRLYEPAFNSLNVEVIHPADVEQDAMMSLIRAVKAGDASNEISALIPAIRYLESQNTEALLIACTELSVISEHARSQLPVFDASQILAEEVVARAVG